MLATSLVMASSAGAFGCRQDRGRSWATSRPPTSSGRRSSKARSTRARNLALMSTVLGSPGGEGDVSGQIALVEDQLTKGITGLALAPADPAALVPTIDKALKQGVKIVYIDRPGRASSGITYVGTANEPAALSRRQVHLRSRREGQRGRDPPGHHGDRQRQRPRPWQPSRARRMRHEDRRRADRRVGQRQGPGRDRKYPDGPPEPQGAVCLQRQHGHGRDPGPEERQDARQGRRSSASTATPRRPKPSSRAKWPSPWRSARQHGCRRRRVR